MNPPNGFKEEGKFPIDLFTVENQILDVVEELSGRWGIENSVFYLSPLFMQSIQNNEYWNLQYAALSVASKIANEASDIEKLDEFTKWALLATRHNHPKVRYASLQLIGQYASDLRPKFIQKYFNEFVPLTMDLFQDSVPRVVSHVLASLDNFFEYCENPWMVELALNKYLPVLLNLIQNGSSLIVEGSVVLISSMATSRNTFGEQLVNIIELGFSILDKFNLVEEYSQVVNKTV